MNNNNNRNSNNNNNRRRGRGNRNQGGGGGQQQNRIDSRARGNAPQLLDKYKKLAQDAQHNGDRVQAEYYLQFADHYFRVIADNKVRQDDTRGRRDEREYDDDDNGEFGSDDAADARPESRPELRAESRPEPRADRSDRGGQDRGQDRGQRNQRQARPRRDDHDSVGRGAEGEAFSADENPFARDDRDERDEQHAARPARTRRPERAPRAERTPDAETESRDGQSENGEQPERRPARRRASSAETSADAPAAFDVAVLPPSISAAPAAAGDDVPTKSSGLKPRRRRTAGDAEDAVVTADS